MGFMAHTEDPAHGQGRMDTHTHTHTLWGEQSDTFLNERFRQLLIFPGANTLPVPSLVLHRLIIHQTNNEYASSISYLPCPVLCVEGKIRRQMPSRNLLCDFHGLFREEISWGPFVEGHQSPSDRRKWAKLQREICRLEEQYGEEVGAGSIAKFPSVSPPWAPPGLLSHLHSPGSSHLVFLCQLLCLHIASHLDSGGPDD